MTLFDKIREFLAGNDETDDPDSRECDEPRDESQRAEDRSSDPPTDPMTAASAGSGGTRMQSHGSHWDTLVPDADRGTAIKEVTMATVSEGDVVASVERKGTDVTGYRLGDGPVGAVAVSLDGEIVTSYPVVDGVTHDVRMESINEWASELEAWLGGSLGDAAITTFAANYFERPAADFGGDCTVSLALLAYDFGQSEYDTVVDENGEERDVSDFVGFRPWERGAPDDYVVRTTVEEIDRVSCAGYEGYFLRVPLFRTDDGEERDVALFVADHVAGDYVPQIGDTVEGACWLQAWFR